jgi:(1->4)-alpha-D-glucan 1-alpha-D-glucosylmutase
MKLHVIARALELRARRPEVFGPGSSYTPVTAGTEVCAFTRGAAEGDGAGDVLVVVPLRASATGVSVEPEPGRYRDVLSGREHELAGPVAVAQLVEPHGMALLERV